MRFNSIAARIAATLVLAVVLSFTLIILVNSGYQYWTVHSQPIEQSDSKAFFGPSFVGMLNRHHPAPQMLAASIATIASAVGRARPSDRAVLVTALTDPFLGVELHDTPSLDPRQSNPRLDLAREIIEFLLQGAPGSVRVAALRETTDHADAAAPAGLRAEIELPDGKWLAVTSSDFAGVQGPRPIALGLLIPPALLIALLSVWTARRLTRPISAFAAAAERFGASTEAIPLAESGPQELRAATRTFNQMQERLRRFVSDRTLMIAAISHDLKTPLTRMKLRAELIADDAQQGKMLTDIDEMTAMIDSTLSFASDDAKREAPLLVDLGALVETVCENALDIGQDIDMSPRRETILVTCRPIAISRAIANLIDNAVKYGGCARLRLNRIADRAVVTIEDDGPGIPEDEHETVFAPFYRLENSRNRDTGGVGLGLAVARTAAREHGGDVMLGTAESGGLHVRLELPAVSARADKRARRLAATG